MNKSIKAQQGGFTLIELIVVIVILGILAATALPRFASLSGEARLASLNAARGALSATAAMTHGKWLVTRATPIAVEGTNVAMDPLSGYPTAAANFATAAGLTGADYTIIPPGTAAGANNPATLGDQIAIIPNSVAGDVRGANCFVRYTAATVANAAPTYTVGAANQNNANLVAACE
jgi:MSHA pilin protein MshA